MGRAKLIEFYNGRYKGNLTEHECETLESLIALDSEDGCLHDIRHEICNMDKTTVSRVIYDYENFGYLTEDYDLGIGTLRDDQTVGVAFMYYSKRCINGDSGGMGKTVQVAALSNLLYKRNAKEDKPFRVLILTEKKVASQFRDEMIRFTGRYHCLIPDGEKKSLERFLSMHSVDSELDHSIVGTHALLTSSSFISWMEQCRIYGEGFPFDMLVIDESSILGSSKTKVVESFKLIKDRVEYCIFLNATPMESKLNIFFTQLDLLDKSYMPTKTNFEKEFCMFIRRGYYSVPSGKYKNEEQFRHLVGYRYFARSRRDKGALMEGCDGELIVSPLSKAQKHWMRRTQMKRYVYDCPTYLDDSIAFNEENVPKLTSLLDLLKGKCQDAETIILYVYNKETQRHLGEFLNKLGYSNRCINGDTDNRTRDSIIESFGNKEFRFLITNVKKGLNFGFCDHCIFYGYDANPSSMMQVEWRMEREFDIIGKNVYILSSEGPEYKTIQGVVRDRADATSKMTNTDYSIVMDILIKGVHKYDGEGI